MQGVSVVVATAPPKMSGTQSCDFSEYFHLSVSFSSKWER